MCLTSGGQAKAGWGTSGLVLGAGAGRPRGLGQPRAGRHGRARHLGLGGLGGLGVPGGLAHDGVYGEAELVLDLTFEEAGGEGGVAVLGEEGGVVHAAGAWEQRHGPGHHTLLTALLLTIYGDEWCCAATCLSSECKNETNVC